MGKTIKVLPHMCQQQMHDVEQLLQAVDEVGAAATSVIAQGGMGYNLLVEARDRFKQLLMSASSRYRICIEEEEDSTN